MHLKWRLGYCENGLGEAGVELEFDFGDEARNVLVVLPAHIATPSVKLVLLDFSPAENGIRPENHRFVDQIMPSLVTLHNAATDDGSGLALVGRREKYLLLACGLRQLTSCTVVEELIFLSILIFSSKLGIGLTICILR